MNDIGFTRGLSELRVSVSKTEGIRPGPGTYTVEGENGLLQWSSDLEVLWHLPLPITNKQTNK